MTVAFLSCADDERFPVATEEFASYVKQMHANTDHLFSEEYEVCELGCSCDTVT